MKTLSNLPHGQVGATPACPKLPLSVVKSVELVTLSKLKSDGLSPLCPKLFFKTVKSPEFTTWSVFALPALSVPTSRVVLPAVIVSVPLLPRCLVPFTFQL